MKKIFQTAFFIILTVWCFTSSPSVSAFEFRRSDTIRLSEDVNGSLFAVGQNIVIQGVVRGDLYCAGQDIRIEGGVEGDILCAGQYITIEGDVDGDIRAVAQLLSVSGVITRNVTVAGQTIKFMNGSSVGGDVAAAGQTVELSGDILRDVITSGDSVFVGGSITRNAQLTAQSIDVGDSASISGDLVYVSDKTLAIDNLGFVAGTVTRKEPKPKSAIPFKTNSNAINAVARGMQLSSVLVSFFIGAICIVFFPKTVSNLSQFVGQGIGANIAWGLLAMMIFVVTIIGIPVALALAVVFGLTVYISRIFVAMYVGNYLLKRFYKQKVKSQYWSLFIGILALWIVCTVPIFGFLLSGIVLSWGTGTLLRYIKDVRK